MGISKKKPRRFKILQGIFYVISGFALFVIGLILAIAAFGIDRKIDTGDRKIDHLH